MLADVNRNTHQNAEVVSRYRTVLDVDETNVIALNNLAYLLAATDPDEALK